MLQVIKYNQNKIIVREFKRTIKDIARYNIYNNSANQEIINLNKDLNQTIFNKVYGDILPLNNKDLDKLNFYDLKDYKVNLKAHDPIFNYVEKQNNNCSNRKHRLSERIKTYMRCCDIKELGHKTDKILMFASFTINDSHIDKYENNPKLFIKYMQTFIKKIAISYIGNIDYGDEKERLHFHAIILLNKNMVGKLQLTSEQKRTLFDRDLKADKQEYYYLILPHQDRYKLGFYSLREIKNGVSDVDKLSSYITKLTRHSFKASTYNNKVSYSNNISKIKVIEQDNINMIQTKYKGFYNNKLLIDIFGNEYLNNIKNNLINNLGILV